MVVTIDSDFPTGNIVLERIDGDRVYLHQDLRDTATDWFYWCFNVRGAAGMELTFHFTQSRALGVRGPAMSLDDGWTWAWLGSGVVDGNAFRCVLPHDAAAVRLSFAMPYWGAHWQRFIAELADHPLVAQDILCDTPKGRQVEYLRLGAPKAKHRVAITCRHHCCEMMANYSLEGLVRWILRSKDSQAEWLRANVEFFIVPCVDTDGVEDGDQGKNRRPRDHGRDYEGESLYTATEAIRRQLPAWGDGRLRMGLDLHCPWIAGGHNEAVYLVGSEDQGMAREQQRFSGMLESVCQGPLPFAKEDFLPFGQSWNTAANTLGGRSFAHWVSAVPGVVLGTTVEIPYANAGECEVNQESAQGFGEDLARAIAVYLEKP